MMLLASPVWVRRSALGLVERALARSRETGQEFGEALTAMPEVQHAIPADALATIEVPEDYLGATEILRVQLLQRPEVRGQRPEPD